MNRFWVVGEEFHSLGFEEIVSGTEQVFGPFGSRDDAEHTWRNVSEQNRARCTVRFTIAQEQPRVAA